jgi:hypothetical protein
MLAYGPRKKISSLRYKRTLARIGKQLLRSCQVERKTQCRDRWVDVLDSINHKTEPARKWSQVERSISVAIGGKYRCCNRWHDTLISRVDRTTEHSDIWTSDEDSQLKDAVQMQYGKNWDAIAGLVPSRTKNQCKGRWLFVLDLSINRATGRTRKWTPEEHDMPMNALPMQGPKHWNAIAALFPGPTKHKNASSKKKTLITSPF